MDAREARRILDEKMAEKSQQDDGYNKVDGYCAAHETYYNLTQVQIQRRINDLYCFTMFVLPLSKTANNYSYLLGVKQYLYDRLTNEHYSVSAEISSQGWPQDRYVLTLDIRW